MLSALDSHVERAKKITSITKESPSHSVQNSAYIIDQALEMIT